MRRALAIYGAARSGQWDGGGLALGVQLARLVPEDIHDRQPLTGGGGRFTLVVDCRIDNRPDLAASLSISPEAARVMADADFVRAAWETWQEGALDRLVGDFALAVWDAERRCLHLARDFLGKRPLFYHQGPGFFAFATMAKGIHALSDVPLEPDLDTLRDYLALAPQRGPGSFFAQISRVEPGTLVTVHADGRVEQRVWYDWNAKREVRYASDGEYIEAFRATFDRVVSDCLRSTGPVGCHLSGGFDSSAVAATAAAALAKRGHTLTAYTHVPLRGVELDEPRDRFGNEWPLAQALARKYPNIEHLAVEAANREIGGDLDAQYYYYEYPALNLCNLVWMREISQTAGRQRQTVLLTGAMGNMTISLSGQERPAELFRAGHFATWFQESMALTRHGHSLASAFFGRTFATMLPGPAVHFLKRLRGHPGQGLTQVSALRPDLMESQAFRDRMRALDYDPSYRPWPSIRSMAQFVLRRIDLHGQEHKGDLAGFGVDQRDPTSDRRLVELAHGMPSNMFLRNGQSRWMYHQAFGERVPEEIRLEKRRGYQAADWAVRVRRAAPALKQEIARASQGRFAPDLLDMAHLQATADTPLREGALDQATTTARRLKFLRAVSAAGFMRKFEKINFDL